jgi:hypothetical protein
MKAKNQIKEIKNQYDKIDVLTIQDQKRGNITIFNVESKDLYEPKFDYIGLKNLLIQALEVNEIKLYETNLIEVEYNVYNLSNIIIDNETLKGLDFKINLI